MCVTDGTKSVSFMMHDESSGGAMRIWRWSTSTGFDSARYDKTVRLTPEWLKISVVASDPKKFYISNNGIDWSLLLDESQTGFLTYTRVGFAGFVNSTYQIAAGLYMRVHYYKDPDIDPGF